MPVERKNSFMKTKLTTLGCTALLMLATLSPAVANISQLDDKALAASQTERVHNQERELVVKQERKALQAKLDQLKRQEKALEQENKRLSQSFSDNESTLAQLEKKLQLETGSLGELFGVVRQAAKELNQDFERSFITADKADYLPEIQQIISTETLPSLELLHSLWYAMEQKVRASGEVLPVTVEYVNGAGQSKLADAYRLGDVALVGEQGYLKWDSQAKQSQDYLVQPDTTPTAATLEQNSVSLLLDPTRGQLLEQYANKPTLQQRVEQGGVVGQIILGLLAVGLLIALVRGAILLKAQGQISRQLKQPENPTNNPLGRILKVYNKERSQSIESLELRLLEAIIDEQQGLEKGLSMLKLMAALAPMLGLLGTVTGMIETFQVITQFGNSDPKVMAGGISMALITTVLGLVAAMPLLLAHNLLSSRSEAIRGTLEKQSVSLVAERAEKDQVAPQKVTEASASSVTMSDGVAA